jgi:hypothetical protein
MGHDVGRQKRPRTCEVEQMIMRTIGQSHLITVAPRIKVAAITIGDLTNES